MRTAGRGSDALHPRCAVEGAWHALAGGVGRRGGLTTNVVLAKAGTHTALLLRLELDGRRPCAALPTVAMGPGLRRDDAGRDQCPSNDISVRTGTSIARNLSAPPKSGRSMMKQAARTLAPIWRSSLTAPSAVPPVATRSSTTITRSPSTTASS